MKNAHPASSIEAVDEVLHQKRVRAWSGCRSFIRINGIPYEVDDAGSSEVDGYHFRVTRPAETGERVEAECPDCGADTDLFMDDDRGVSLVACEGCGSQWTVESGVPEEFAK